MYMRRFLLLFVLFFTLHNVYAQEEIKMNKEHDGVYTIPCEINGLKLRFIFDTGAAVVSLSMTEALFMLKNGYLENEDILGTANTIVASGEILENYLVNLKEVKIGTKIVNNIKAVVKKGMSAPLLLGQSVLSQLGEWSIRDNYLVLQDRSVNDFGNFTELDWEQRIKDAGKIKDWDERVRFLMPGVYAKDKNTLIIACHDLQFTTKDFSLKDESTILNNLKEIATNGDKDAVFALGDYYLSKPKSIDDYEESKNLFISLIDGKTVFKPKRYYPLRTPYMNLYCLYKEHLGQYEDALSILQQGALLNDEECVSSLLYEYSDRKDYDKLYQWADKLSQVCSRTAKTKAMYSKARCLMEGHGIDKNFQQGIQLLEQIVKSSNSFSDDVLYELCDYYYTNKNYELVEYYASKIEKDFYRNYYLGCAYYFMNNYPSARLHLNNLWNNKDNGMYEREKLGFAICLLGNCYENGLGGEINYAKAESLYKNAYEECKFFGALGYWGDILSNEKIYLQPNYEIAFGCYLQGAKNNDAYCCYMVSQFYKNGIGTMKDSKESKYWLQKAKDNGWKK